MSQREDMKMSMMGGAMCALLVLWLICLYWPA